jgi:hypothetical protein
MMAEVMVSQGLDAMNTEATEAKALLLMDGHHSGQSSGAKVMKSSSGC